MRAIFVNHCHPDCPHVCGTRAREFANALARQGHQIVLLTETLHRDDPAPDPNSLAAALAAHDWRQPFRLACRPRPSPMLEALRTGRLPGPLRKLIVLYQYLMHGGMFTDWRAGSRQYWAVLAEAFRPQVVWGIFGNTDAWAIAQEIAHQSNCPWVRDIKDQWTRFIPAVLRPVLARRFADAAGTTALSQANATNAAPWFPGRATVVYSGIDADLLASDLPQTTVGPWTITLVGATYSPTSLAVLVAGIARFLDGAARGAVRLVYVGTDVKAVKEALQAFAGRIEIDVRGQLPFADYWALITQSQVNMYIRTLETGWWHHKIVELLAARRPILCCPGEIDEAQTLTAKVGGRLYGCADAVSVAAALEKAWSGRNIAATTTHTVDMKQLSWDAQAERLREGFAASGVVAAA